MIKYSWEIPVAILAVVFLLLSFIVPALLGTPTPGWQGFYNVVSSVVVLLIFLALVVAIWNLGTYLAKIRYRNRVTAELVDLINQELHNNTPLYPPDERSREAKVIKIIPPQENPERYKAWDVLCWIPGTNEQRFLKLSAFYSQHTLVNFFDKYRT